MPRPDRALTDPPRPDRHPLIRSDRTPPPLILPDRMPKSLSSPHLTADPGCRGIVFLGVGGEWSAKWSQVVASGVWPLEGFGRCAKRVPGSCPTGREASDNRPSNSPSDILLPRRRTLAFAGFARGSPHHQCARATVRGQKLGNIVRVARACARLFTRVSVFGFGQLPFSLHFTCEMDHRLSVFFQYARATTTRCSHH